jgi:hypothetical protein
MSSLGFPSPSASQSVLERAMGSDTKEENLLSGQGPERTSLTRKCPDMNSPVPAKHVENSCSPPPHAHTYTHSTPSPLPHMASPQPSGTRAHLPRAVGPGTLPVYPCSPGVMKGHRDFSSHSVALRHHFPSLPGRCQRRPRGKLDSNPHLDAPPFSHCPTTLLVKTV